MRRKNDTQNALAFVVRTKLFIPETLRSVISEYLNNRAEPRGPMSLEKLRKSGAKLENVEISEQNIGDFLAVARRYRIDYALKLDKSAESPVYYVFFKADKVEALNRAFTEYVSKKEKAAEKDTKKDIEKKKPEKEIEKDIEPEDIER
jgi:hypothetical protein